MGKLRLSYYTIPVPLTNNAGKLILVHGNTGAIDIISTRLYNLLKSDDCNAKIPDTLMENLKKRGYLTNKTIDEELEYTHKLIS